MLVFKVFIVIILAFNVINASNLINIEEFNKEYSERHRDFKSADNPPIYHIGKEVLKEMARKPKITTYTLHYKIKCPIQTAIIRFESTTSSYWEQETMDILSDNKSRGSTDLPSDTYNVICVTPDTFKKNYTIGTIFIAPNANNKFEYGY